ncbi:hypothetical protein B0H11DRAFT_2254147 [Mycena galericulata]|nr:hypothetical protein B0H11DRAFT_2254147 [Mycena galericulata]
MASRAKRARRGRGHGHIDIPASPPPRSQSTGPPVPTLNATFLRETARMGVDGSIKQDVRILAVPASPGRATGTRSLFPDAPRQRSASCPAPHHVFDLLEQDNVYNAAPVNPDLDDDAPREMRDSDHPLREWVREGREECLKELLYSEGRGVHRQYTICPECCVEKAEYRCRACVVGGELVCKACVIKRHQPHPFHAIEYWTGEFFEDRSLKDLGLRIQLGHWEGQDRRCPVPIPAPGDDFVIVHDHGVAEVALDFCGCGGGSHMKQLLRAGFFPATIQAPRTASTISVLRRFHLLSFESKCSAQGNAHSCPACPQPGKNLPPNWKDAPEEKQFLYALFLAMDTNFRLKRKDVSTEEADPGLGPGWAFFCEVSAYMQHLADNWDQPQERSTCVAHDAVDKPDREARGTASSGIGAVDCARHNMKRPNVVGDLQFGERYLNMDYMFFVSITGTDLMRLYVSYDIACQWHKNIWIRMLSYKSEIQYLGEGKFVTFLVPKFHLPAHIEECNLRFSFNLTRDVGQTDREAPERGWANANPLAASTKEMGPGARRDTLDDHFNDWNYKKIIALGRVMCKKVEDGVPVMVEMKAALKELEASLEPAVLGTEEGPVAEWTKMAEKWEEDPEAPNPFQTLRKDEHLAKVRHDLAVEAAARHVAGREDATTVREEMHITEVISMGLQMEEQQRVLRFDVAATGQHPTADQSRTMVERTSKLRRKILAWIDIQRGFFPVVDALRAREDEARARIAKTQPIPGVPVYDLRLWLPSAIMKQPEEARREQSIVMQDAQNYEYRLRVGQANESLHEIRRQLLVRTHLYKYKDVNAWGVRQNMRSSEKIEVCNDRVRRMAAQYRAARGALVVLGRVLENDEWEKTLRPLADTDLRGMPRATFADPERQKGAPKGKKRRMQKRKGPKPPTEVSWIWIAQAEGAKPGESAAMNEALRIEWAKARARFLCWREEIDLLEEEMRRIQQFLTWRSVWWQDRVDVRGLPDGAQREGETAYALRQAKLSRDRCAKFAQLWSHLPELIATGREGQVAAAANAL